MAIPLHFRFSEPFLPVQATVIAAVALVFAVIVGSRQIRAWLKYRGQRVIRCPENQQPVGVTLDARHAASTAMLGGCELRLSECTRWPERAGCGQPCLSQIATAPEDCLVVHILANWYEGKACAFCGAAFGQTEWRAAKPALLLPDRVPVEWSRIPADKLYQTLETARPVCFACHTANAMIHTRPELVVDRSRNRVADAGDER